MYATIPTVHKPHHCRCGNDVFRIYETKSANDPMGSTLGFQAACTSCGCSRGLQHKVAVQETLTIQEFATPEEVGMPFTPIMDVVGGRIYECNKCKKKSPTLRDGVQLFDYMDAHRAESPACAFTVSYILPER